MTADRPRFAKLGTYIGALAGFVTAVAGGMPARAEGEQALLRFVRDGEAISLLTLTQLRERCGEERVEVEDDPYYERRTIFLAIPLHCALEAGFGEPVTELAGEGFLLRALDGYSKPASGATLAEPGGYLAFADAELTDAKDEPFVAHWRRIEGRDADPGPFYLVWDWPRQQDRHLFPWPYQLATVEIASFEASHPHTLPTGAPPDSPARAGFEIFRRDCASCHPLNGEGGAIGPDLNIPRSIVEYRSADQIKAFVRNPASFRYSSMPGNPHLSDADLDALVAYLTWMKDHKRDPRSE